MTTTLLDVTRAQAPHLKAAAVARLRAALAGERPQQLAKVEASDATAVRLARHRDDDSILEREVAELTASRARAAVADIDAALERMADGTYGRCTTCGQPIPLERLDAIPHVRSCVACQGGSRRSPFR